MIRRRRMIQEAQMTGIAGRTGRLRAQQNTKPREDGCERCVCCRRQVDIRKDTDIEFRPFYVEGAGQLCYDCYSELYGRS
jgi:hypothetical protein